MAAVCLALVLSLDFSEFVFCCPSPLRKFTPICHNGRTYEKNIVMHTEHADRLLVLMRTPVRKPQIDFRIYRFDFCHEALLMRIPLRKSKSTFHRPLGSFIIIKRVSRSGRSVNVVPGPRCLTGARSRRPGESCSHPFVLLCFVNFIYVTKLL